MAQHHKVTLVIDDNRQEELLASWQKVEDALTKIASLRADSLAPLQKLMRQTLDEQEGFTSICEDARLQPRIVHLSSDSPALTNLPWRLAIADVPQLYLVKGLATEKTPTVPAVAKELPLKVLVMISAPENSTGGRLNYEEEEGLILRAFEPLFNSGLVEIDFCEDGSLETLEAKLKRNSYHVLHFSGHGTFDPEHGTLLELEDQLTMAQKVATGNEFIQSLNVKEAHRPSLVLLSSCLTAKGGEDKHLQGLALDLLEAGAPATVAMSLSVLDTYATQFAGQFYKALAERLTIYQAFHRGLQSIKELEAKQKPEAAPAQWMIPQLLTQPELEHIVDWEKVGEAAQVKKDNRLLFGEYSLRDEQRPENYRFVGRRKDRKRALPVLMEGGSVLLRGQGGVGKTSLAEHLISRLLAAKGGRLAVFAFNETTADLEHVQEKLIEYLEKEKDIRNFSIRYDIEDEPSALRRCNRLLAELSEHREPVFVFDNLETLQTEAGKSFKDEHSDTAKLLERLNQMNIPMLLTCRYPVPEAGEVTDLDLNTVSFNDFLRKCLQLSLRELPQRLREKKLAISSLEASNLTYRAVVQWLYDTFGGNYRALEFFDKIYDAEGKRLDEALRSLEDFKDKFSDKKEEVLQQMSRNLLFSELISTLETAERDTLALLANFRIPVLLLALDMQIENDQYAKLLNELAQLTLVEIRPAPASALIYYYVTPLVRELLEETRGIVAFNHELAGRYYRHCYHQVNYCNCDDLAEAWHHFLLADNKEEVNRSGSILTRYYYDCSLFQQALYYGRITEDCCKAGTDSVIFNRLGLIFKISSSLDRALYYFQLCLRDSRLKGDKKSEALTLNNLATLAHDKSDNTMALKYLRQSLDIQREIRDMNGAGLTLNNIGLFYKKQGNYGQALEYYEQSLALTRELGDRQGEALALNNLAATFQAKGNITQALEYLEQSLNIRRDIGDKIGEDATLNNIGMIYKVQENYGKALEYFEQSLVLARETGDKRAERAVLNNIGEVYRKHGGYDQAWQYLKQSLVLSQDTGDKRGEILAHFNLGSLAKNKDTALYHMEQCLVIGREIGDKQWESKILDNIGVIFENEGDYDRAIQYYEQSLTIRRGIGDIQGISDSLYNMSIIAQEKEDHKLAFEYKSEAWKLACQVGYIKGVFEYGYSFALMLVKAGAKDECLQVLRQSYELCKAANYRRAEELAALIQQL